MYLFFFFFEELKVFFFFFLKSFNLWRPLLIIALCYQTKAPISFWCKWGLNPRSLIQPSDTLLVELTGTYHFPTYLYYYFEFCVVTSVFSERIPYFFFSVTKNMKNKKNMKKQRHPTAIEPQPWKTQSRNRPRVLFLVFNNNTLSLSLYFLVFWVLRLWCCMFV